MGLPSIKQKIGNTLLAAADLAGLVFAGSGAAVVLFMGKVMAAVVLGAAALGFFLRFASRKGVREAPKMKTPGWARALAAAMSVVVVAALVEATNFPVRFDQAGFERWHWLLVIAALAVAYSLCSGALGALTRGKRSDVAPQP